MSSPITAAAIKRCRMQDETCLREQTKNYFVNYAQGIPEHGVPAIEPLQLGTLHINSGENSASLQFSLTMMNTTMHHFSESVQLRSIKGFTRDLSKPMKLFWVITLPELEVRAQYDVNGKILILPIVSQGDVIINLYNVQAKSRVTVEAEKRADGQNYLKIVDYRTIAKVDS